jgi:hypothetical protein
MCEQGKPHWEISKNQRRMCSTDNNTICDIRKEIIRIMAGVKNVVFYTLPFQVQSYTS